MGMLDRYKKTGGFNQLLTLLETCGQQKQQRFLEIIREEDPRWADALVAKMIDIKRLLTWSESAIGEVTGAMLEINVAAIIKSLPPDQGQKMLATLAHIKRRKVEDLLDTMNPSAGEIAVSTNKLFETIRKLTQDGILRLDKIDPMLFVDPDIEDRLTQGKDIAGVPSFSESMAAHAARPTSAQQANPATGTFSTLTGTFRTLPDQNENGTLKVASSLDAATLNDGSGKDLKSAMLEIQQLRKKVADLQNETGLLKQDLSQARLKLEQIRKIA